MDIFSKHFVIFLYIISFLIGISVITAIAIIASKEKSQLYSSLRIVITIFLAIDLINFLQFYKEFFFIQWEMNLGIMFLFDISGVAFVYYWLRHYKLLNEEPLGRPSQILMYITGFLYIFIWAIVYIFNMDQNYQISNFLLKIITFSTEIFFYAIFIAIVISNLIKYIKKSTHGKEKNYYIILTFIVLYYYIWLLYWDIRLVFPPKQVLPLGSGAFDFVIICAYLIYGLTLKYLYDINKNESILKSYDRENAVHEHLSLESLADKYHLSNRERELAELVLKGLSNPDISNALNISNNTVKRHMNNIYRKINISSRFELICLIKKE